MLTSVETDLIRVLGDPLRLRIVTLLARETLCTTHLVEETGARQTNLSNHLKVLREAGVVDTEPCGRFTYYRLKPEVLEGLAGSFAELAAAARRTAAGDVKRSCP
ncbi:metalloregulator ArsR/SmtB family transcription factor [Actinacidiphila alni]|uniref:ArsR/SmtB family transcription factor n=1 Tax=Actinacidiphila alni TaxID=380248 RepID=UPI0033EC860F